MRDGLQDGRQVSQASGVGPPTPWHPAGWQQILGRAVAQGSQEAGAFWAVPEASCVRGRAIGLGGPHPGHLAYVRRGQGSWLCSGRPLSFSSEPGTQGTWRSVEPPHGEGCPFGQAGLLGRAAGAASCCMGHKGGTWSRGSSYPILPLLLPVPMLVSGKKELVSRLC